MCFPCSTHFFSCMLLISVNLCLLFGVINFISYIFSDPSLGVHTNNLLVSFCLNHPPYNQSWGTAGDCCDSQNPWLRKPASSFRGVEFNLFPPCGSLKPVVCLTPFTGSLLKYICICIHVHAHTCVWPHTCVHICACARTHFPE